MSEEQKPGMQPGWLRSLLFSIWRWNGEKAINWEGVSAFYGAMAALCMALYLLGDTYPVFAGWWVVLSPFIPCAIVCLCGLFFKLATTRVTDDNTALSAEAQARKFSKLADEKKD